jgi:hypothetical protein
MEPGKAGKQRDGSSGKFVVNYKLIFAIVLAIVAGIVAYTQIFRVHPAQSTVKKAFDLVSKGNLEGVMQYVDPEGQLGILWNQNQDGARDKLLSLTDRYRLEFDSLKFKTRAEGDLAEVELKGGRVSIYTQEGTGPPAAVLDLGGSDLVFEMEKKGGQWLIEGVNYDISRLLSGDIPFSPF